MSLGSDIKRYRKVQGITATELAKRVGISKGYMSELENDRAPRPGVGVVHRISAELGITPQELMGESAAPVPPACRHWYLAMGQDGTAVCLYCSTRFNVTEAA